MRKFSLIIAAMLVFAAAGVQAQVAAPSLNPFFSGDNPAVLPLNASSQLGYGYLSFDAEFTAGGTTTPAASGTGGIVNLSWVGESFAIAYGQLGLDLDIDPSAGTGTFSVEQSAFEMGLRLGSSSFLLGVALESSKDSGPSGVGEDIFETSLTNVGGVWKLGDTFYLGGTYGTETATRADSFTGTVVDSEGDHNVYRYGAAFYSRDKESGYHFEVNREESSVLEILDAGGTTQYLKSYEETGIVVEYVFSDFLIGIEATKSNEETADINFLFAVETMDTSEQVISLGYVPVEGLNLILMSLVSEETDQAGNVFTLTGSALLVSWAF